MFTFFYKHGMRQNMFVYLLTAADYTFLKGFSSIRKVHTYMETRNHWPLTLSIVQWTKPLKIWQWVPLNGKMRPNDLIVNLFLHLNNLL
jgi:hypothetical protein